MKVLSRGLVAVLLLAVASSFAQNVIITSAGNGIAGYGGDGGPAINTSLNTPEAIVFDSPAGNMYVADYNNARVRKITPAGVISTYPGGGPGGLGDGGIAILATLSGPVGLAIDASNNLYISDYLGQRIRRVDFGTGIITTVAGTGTSGNTGDGGAATSATLRNPYGIGLDSTGTILYVADYNNNRVRKIVIGGNITNFAGSSAGTSGFSGDTGAATSALLQQPKAVIVDGTGNVYISDYFNNRVRKVDLSLNINTIAGSSTSNSFSGDGGQATLARFANLGGIVFDGSGNILCVDSANSRIRSVNLSSGIINTIIGNGTNSAAGDGGLATSAGLSSTTDFVGVDGSGNVYIADLANNRVRKVMAPPTGTAAPTLTSLVPSGIQVAYGSFTLTVNGTNFVAGATVRWNGVDHSTTFISSTQLTATIAPSDDAVAGSPTVTVFNPGGGGVSASGLTFTVFAAPAAPTALITTFAGNGIATYDGDGGQAVYTTLNHPNGMVFDGSGNMYFADSSNNRIRKITPAGIISTVAGGGGSLGDGGPATAAQLNNPIGVALDGSGNLYIADYNNYRIRKVAAVGGVITAGSVITTIGGTGSSGFSGDGATATLAAINHPYGIASDAAGNVYFSDSGNNRVRKITTGGVISTFAGNGIAGYFGDGGPAIYSTLRNPRGVALDSFGNLYIGDYDNYRVRKVALDGTISTLAGNGTNNFGGDGGPAVLAKFSQPQGVFVDSSGNVYIAEDSNQRVRKVDGTGTINSVAGSGSTTFSGDGGLAINAGIYNPEFAVVDASGTLYISENGNNRIRKVSAPTTSNPVPSFAAMIPSKAQAGIGAFTMVINGSNFVPGAVVQWNGAPRVTTYIGSTQLTAAITLSDVFTAGTANVTVFNPTTGGGGGASSPLVFTIYNAPAAPTALIITAAGTAFTGYSGDGGAALFSALSSPEGLAFDGSGSLYVADYGNNRIRKISSAGIISTYAGNGTSGFSGDGGPATAAQINQPIGLAFDPSGNLYISDRSNQRIRKVTPGGVISTFAGNGTQSFSGDGGAATGAALNNPWGVATDAAGNVYIADGGNNRLRKVLAADGTINTIAGNAFTGYFGDGGPATAAPLNFPVGIVVEPVTNNVYFSDNTNHRVRKISAADGTISTVAGAGSCNNTGDGGAAIYGTLCNPRGLALDLAGNLYIADTGNNRVREVDTGGIITTVAGTGTGGFSGDGGLATASTMNSTNFLAIDGAGSIYITDLNNSRIRKVLAAPTGNPLPSLVSLTPTKAVTGSASFSLAVKGSNFVPGAEVRWNGAARTTTYLSSTQLTAVVGTADLLSVTTATVTVFNPTLGGGGGTSGGLSFTVIAPPAASTAVALTQYGNGLAAFSGDGGPALYSSFNAPRGLAFDAAGNLYIADTGNHRIRMVSPTGIVSTVAGNGVAGFAGDGGSALIAQMKSPIRGAIESTGKLYISLVVTGIFKGYGGLQGQAFQEVGFVNTQWAPIRRRHHKLRHPIAFAVGQREHRH